MKKKKVAPETAMMHAVSDPENNHSAVKTPIFRNSTFIFKNAHEGRKAFAEKLGLPYDGPRVKHPIYGRLNNPNFAAVEKLLAIWDETEEGLLFSSGMAAISTALLTYLKPGDDFIYSTPVYGGTHLFVNGFLESLDIKGIPMAPGESIKNLQNKYLDHGRNKSPKLIYLETPANPTNYMYDIGGIVEIAKQWSSKQHKVLVMVDNTFLGPIWQKPAKLGADLIIYSATKFLGGHSDLVAGAITGSSEDIKPIRKLRSLLGSIPDPEMAWLLQRSLETLKIRMEAQMKTAVDVAEFLESHLAVDKVEYPGCPNSINDDQQVIFKKQCYGSGSLLSLFLKGGREEAYTFLDNLELFNLAVSLGGTESLAQHPATMTHAGVEPELRSEIGVSENLVRLSIGIESSEDLIRDLENALSLVRDQVGMEEIQAS
jgi:methionine-gamma-lyase